MPRLSDPVECARWRLLPVLESQRSKARYQAFKFLRNPEPCEVCGTTEEIHRHHDDYSKPLEVRWLCATHHREWHRHNKALPLIQKRVQPQQLEITP